MGRGPTRRELIGALCGAALAGCGERAPALPWLRPIEARPAEGAPTTEAVRLVLSSLPASTRARVLSALVEVAERAQASQGPFALGLDDEPLLSPLAPYRHFLLPALNAALSLVARWYEASDGRLVAVAAAGAGALPLFASGGEAADERLRICAWAYTRSLLLRCDHGAARARVVEALREGLVVAGAAQALVLDEASLSQRERVSLGELPSIARAARRRKIDDAVVSAVVESLAGDEVARLLAPLALGEGEVLLVPREGQLARPERLLAAARQASAGLRVRHVGPGRPTLAAL